METIVVEAELSKGYQAGRLEAIVYEGVEIG